MMMSENSGQFFSGQYELNNENISEKGSFFGLGSCDFSYISKNNYCLSELIFVY